MLFIKRPCFVIIITIWNNYWLYTELVLKYKIDNYKKHNIIFEKPNEIVERLLCKDVDDKIATKLDELSFYKKQMRIVYLDKL